MVEKRKVQIFSAGCPLCSEAVEVVNRISCPSCEVEVLNMEKPDVADQARSLGIRTVPAIIINGKLARCCKDSGPDEKVLLSLGVGTPL